MAVDTKQTQDTPDASRAQTVRLTAGANVFVASLLAVALVAVLQWGGYTFNAKADLTTGGINSLSDGTERLLDSLEDEVRITSLYYESDLESEDQRARKATADVIELYRISNPGKIVTAYVNPLQDHKRRKELFARLQGIPLFAEQAKPYQDLLNNFNETIGPKLATLLGTEQEELADRTGASAEGNESRVKGAIANYFNERQLDLADVQEVIKTTEQNEIADYAATWRTLRAFYNSVEAIPTTLEAFVKDNAALLQGVSPDVTAYFRAAAERFRPIAEQVSAEVAKGVDLPDLEIERIARAYTPTGNCVIVDTDKDARIITFADMWPPSTATPSPDGEPALRELRGEEKLSSAILQITQEKKPAVTFVRYGGPPLFFGGMRPNMPRPAFMQMKEHLESLNFTVNEWNLAASTTPPEIDPKPDKQMYVVLRPAPPPSPMMAQQQQDPPFGEEHRQALLTALGSNARALFITGWSPATLGPMATPYEYGEYLRDTWGLEIAEKVLVIETRPVGPNEFRLGRGFENLRQPTTGDHIIIKGLGSGRSMFPLVAPLETLDPVPDGVEIETLLWFKPNDGLWGVSDIQTRIQKAQQTGFIDRSDGDMLGPFTLATAAKRDDARIVVVSSPFFANDEVAFATQMVLTAQGLGVVRAYPSNVALFVNALHWLADNTQWMDLGRPIDTRALTIEDGPSLQFVRVLVYGLWPALALALGACVWIVRRR